MPATWTCSECGTRQFRTRGKRCVSCNELTQPAPRSRRAKQEIPKIEYGDAAILSVLIHGGEPHGCAYCGKPRREGGRRLDKDHEKGTDRFRGLLHVRCNKEKVRAMTLDEAKLLVAYLERVDRFYANVGVA